MKFILVVFFVFNAGPNNTPQFTAPTTIDTYHSYEDCNTAGEAWQKQVNPNYAKFSCVPSGRALGLQ